MHHFNHKKKIELYKRIYKSLKQNGCYIECDYMVKTQEEEDFFFFENKRLRREHDIRETEYYHYDTPCTVDNQKQLLSAAGFLIVEQVFNIGNTVILVAK